jgi:hypothetical protein
MRSTLVCAAILTILGVSASASAQTPDQPVQPPVNQDVIKDPDKSPNQATKPLPPPPPVPASQIAAGGPAGDSLAAAARKAREQKKDQAQAASRVFDNASIPKQGGVSSVGASADASTTDANGAPAGDSAGGAAAPGGTPSPSDEKHWRELFAGLRKKQDQDQASLDIMQRELGVLDVQYYNDPNKAMEQNLTRSDINEKTAKIDAAKQQVESDKQAISDAEDQLRKAGGDIGWSR